MSTKKLQILGSIGSNVEIDATLTQKDQAADAKVVGDALTSKIDRNEIQNAIEFCAEMGLVDPVIAEDGSIYTDENGVLYTL